MLEVEGVTKRFGALVALDNVSFKVNGKRLGIIGPNGAGKTTLFNVISGFLKPNSGKIWFNGKDITGLRPSKIAEMGLVRTFQLLKVFKSLTVQENLSIVSDDSRDLLELVGLWEKRNIVAGNLSQGEMRKLGIALALAKKPKMLLLDEPFSGLSPVECESLIEVLKDVKTPMVLIEHKLGELFDLVDRVVVLNFGRVIFEGKPEEAVRNSRVVEAYIGEDYA
ncbi:ABC transporter ATP-binding protein [Archaeoglobus profundus]|uniref:ABC transporter related protein n=1 Tax=Archaeoglobus profundus (strain DSM 5631 / JCM 9629 / NBRC 100127 / Av18) TaxID=572546 RepID=D2RG47_ARCPA|nr:ABC transporter ATP-binding protein [Archaeoglobus profundus]ADB57272.1 ABC transporter related protein [Archaeoglobus profundus DSM 5631]